MKGKITLTIPQSCRECRFFSQAGEYQYKCLVVEGSMNEHIEWLKHHYAAERPTWCPICEDKFIIPIGEHKIITNLDDIDTPEFPPQIDIYLCDKNDVIIQDLALVRPHYNIVKGRPVINNNTAEIFCLE